MSDFGQCFSCDKPAIGYNIYAHFCQDHKDTFVMDETPDQKLAVLRKQLIASEHQCKKSEPYARRTKYDRANMRKRIMELEQQIAQSK